jgi:hypothetical protein
MLQIPGTQTSLPAVQLPSAPTRAGNAWRAGYITIRLLATLEAIRVHTGGGEGAATRPELVGAGLHGRWFAIGDVVQTYGQYRASRALPADFTEIAIATFAPGTVLNVGICGPLFGHRGGGEQAELVSGPPPQLRTLDAIWSREAGHA